MSTTTNKPKLKAPHILICKGLVAGMRHPVHVFTSQVACLGWCLNAGSSKSPAPIPEPTEGAVAYGIRVYDALTEAGWSEAEIAEMAKEAAALVMDALPPITGREVAEAQGFSRAPEGNS